jgi:NAD(P)H-dependent FMN reductase
LAEITRLEQMEAKKEKQMEKQVLQLQLAQTKDDKEKDALSKRITELGKQIREHD